MEEAAFWITASLLRLDTELSSLDATSRHEEIDEVDEGQRRRGQGTGPSRTRTNPKNGRRDAPRVATGMAVAREWFPVRRWVFLVNTADGDSVQQATGAGGLTVEQGVCLALHALEIQLVGGSVRGACQSSSHRRGWKRDVVRFSGAGHVLGFADRPHNVYSRLSVPRAVIVGAFEWQAIRIS